MKESHTMVASRFQLTGKHRPVGNVTPKTQELLPGWELLCEGGALHLDDVPPEQVALRAIRDKSIVRESIPGKGRKEKPAE